MLVVAVIWAVLFAAAMLALCYGAFRLLMWFFERLFR